MKKTALVFSGGGSRGAYEIGVWKALDELGIKIDMVAGTSVGAINGALYIQNDLSFAVSLWHKLETDMIFDVSDDEYTFKETLDKIKLGGMSADDALGYIREIVLHGGAGTSGLEALLDQYLNEDIIRKSSVEYGLVTTEFPSLNGAYMFLDDIPEGQLRDYILASASCFPAVRKCTIGDKQYIDGGYNDNLPVSMALARGATSIIAVDLQAAGITRKASIEEAKEKCEEFHLIKSPLDLGNFLIFDKESAEKIITLGYLDTMRHFGHYDGIRYTFKKGEFNNHQLIGADNAAYMLEPDPCKVYTKASLIDALKPVIEKHTECCNSLKDYINNAELRGQLLIYIAKSLKEDEEKSMFMQPTLLKALKAEVQAANFLVQNGLV